MTLHRTRKLDIYVAIKELMDENKGYPLSGLCRIADISRLPTINGSITSTVIMISLMITWLKEYQRFMENTQIWDIYDRLRL